MSGGDIRRGRDREASFTFTHDSSGIACGLGAGLRESRAPHPSRRGRPADGPDGLRDLSSGLSVPVCAGGVDGADRRDAVVVTRVPARAIATIALPGDSDVV